ncbi:divalent-cation tolerance protein CutA [Candidatus Laterigemmans baculatus]|uniref:divalent-cation tolerance protein CutA n=1 Tax=Candidatus Laterigemmans baculatus TaxID=2770505 RepID=UPI0013DD3DF9|nr:divalent-cation tolerance protein CutA [Candidatus Laterigemmans baculatus]
MTHLDAVQIVTTVAEKSAAETLAQGLVQRRLAACVQIDGPLASVYRWAGEIEQASEFRLTLKTTAAAARQAIAYLGEAHPYDEPEILMIPVAGGSDGYLRWLAAEVDADAAGSEANGSDADR